MLDGNEINVISEIKFYPKQAEGQDPRDCFNFWFCLHVEIKYENIFEAVQEIYFKQHCDIKKQVCGQDRGHHFLLIILSQGLPNYEHNKYNVPNTNKIDPAFNYQ